MFISHLGKLHIAEVHVCDYHDPSRMKAGPRIRHVGDDNFPYGEGGRVHPVVLG